MIKNQKDLLAGLLFVVFGVGFAAIGSTYEIGTTLRIGPGYLPTALGVVLALLGLSIGVGAVRPGPGDEGTFAWKALAIITVGAVVFGLIVRGAGLVPAVFVLVLVCAAVSIRFRWVTAIPLAAGLAVFSWFIFVREIGLPFAPFGKWLGF